MRGVEVKGPNFAGCCTQEHGDKAALSKQVQNKGRDMEPTCPKL